MAHFLNLIRLLVPASCAVLLPHTRRNLKCALFSVAGLLFLSACTTNPRSESCTYTEEEIVSIKQQAKDGDAAKLIKLAGIYQLGSCVKRDTQFAVKLIQQAAYQGNVTAQRKVGLSYYNGWGVEQDLAYAAYWFREAAKSGDGIAQHRLGLMYQKGIGVNQDLEEAKKWYEKSSAQGDYGSRKALEVVVCEMDIDSCEKRFGEETRKRYEERKTLAEARREQKRNEFLLLTEAANQGDPVAQYNLGKIYSYSVSEYQIEQNLSAASTWFHKSADQGYSEGQFSLGLMYEAGTGDNSKDIDKAKYLYEKASAQGHISANRRLCELSEACTPEYDPKGDTFNPAALLLCLMPYTFWMCLQ
ncbi:sel1 repeat family protein [Gammaproteobacteria bacterium]|nr:sel1 repeat family protein [Gammaproteobacteria bacterium]